MLKRSCLIYINLSFIVQNLNKMHVCCLPKKLIHTETWNKDLLPRSLSTSEVKSIEQSVKISEVFTILTLYIWKGGLMGWVKNEC